MSKIKNNYSVYIHTNKINGKKYIGITKLKPKHRWSNGNGYKSQPFGLAIDKYGWDNFSHEILYEGLPAQDAKNKEIELISLYDTTDNTKGYNISFGGDLGTLGVLNNESLSIKVYQYNLNGDFVKEYPSMMEAERCTGIDNAAICACCKGRNAYTKDYIWSYEYHEKIEKIDKDEHYINTVLKEQYKPVYMYSLDGILINSFESLSYASKVTGVNFKLISKCCLGERNQTHGYIFAYIKTEDFDTLLNRREFNTIKGKPVIQYKEEVLIGSFSSIMDAVRQTGVSKSKISRCCNNKVKSVDGYIFKFKNSQHGEHIYSPILLKKEGN